MAQPKPFNTLTHSQALQVIKDAKAVGMDKTNPMGFRAILKHAKEAIYGPA